MHEPRDIESTVMKAMLK